MNSPLSYKKQRVRQEMMQTISRCRRLYGVSVILVLSCLALGPIGMLVQRYYGLEVRWPWVVYWVALVTAVLLWMLRGYLLRTLEYQLDKHNALAEENEPNQGDDHGK